MNESRLIFAEWQLLSLRKGLQDALQLFVMQHGQGHELTSGHRKVHTIYTSMRNSHIHITYQF